MDTSFGGMYTKIRNIVSGGVSEEEKADICYSMQETVFAMLVEVSERALAHVGKKELLLGGGVACNKRLQEMCSIMCSERGATSFALPNQFNVDNAAMIAWLGKVMYDAGVRMTIPETAIRPYERTDDVDVVWR